MAEPKDENRRDTRRRFEQWARNPTCESNTLSAIHGISMADVAKKEGLPSTMGQSPFAVTRGQSFERGLFRDDGEALRKELEKHGVLPADSAGFIDLRLKQHGGPMRGMDNARAATLELLRDLADQKSKRKPTLIASPTLLIPSGVMLPEALLLVDVIAITHPKGGGAVIHVGEIKTYPDRGGHTDPEELAGARAQAGVYVHALRMVIGQLGLSAAVTVSDRGFLVLSKPGFNQPSVRANEDLKYQAWRAERGFAQLEAAAARLPWPETPKDQEKMIKTIIGAETTYSERCISFCDRAAGCWSTAVESGDPRVLGDDVARFLGGTSLDRALALMEGGRPRDEAEKALKARLAAS